MAKSLPIAICAGFLLCAAWAQAGSDVARSGKVGTNASDSIDQSMRVMTYTGNVRAEPNVQAKVVAILFRQSKVTMIGTANGGAWAHVLVGNLNGYMDLVQLRRVSQENIELPPVQQTIPTAPGGQTTTPPSHFQASSPSPQTTGGFYEPPLRKTGGQGAMIYERPDVQSHPLSFLPPGRQVSLIGSVGGCSSRGKWYRWLSQDRALAVTLRLSPRLNIECRAPSRGLL
jgi:hypothetical protein